MPNRLAETTCLLAIALGLAAPAAHAEVHQECAGIGRMARSLVMERDAGTPYGDIRKRLDKLQDPGARKLFGDIAAQIFENPTYKRITPSEALQEYWSRCEALRMSQGK